MGVDWNSMSFQGAFRFSGGKKLNDHQYRYLLLFWQIERCQRNIDEVKECPDPVRELVGLPLGAKGEFFLSSKDFLDLPTETQTQFLQTRRFGNEYHDHLGGWDTSQTGLIKNDPHGRESHFHTFRLLTAFRDRKEPCHWVPTLDACGIEWCYNRRTGIPERSVSFDGAVFWIQWIADNILRPWGLTLEGEVWYQGESQTCTGRLVILTTGSIVKQTARGNQIPNMLGAAASNSVSLAKTLPGEQLVMRDPFGRTPLLLAAWFKSHEMLDWLSTQLQDDTWQLDAVFARKPCYSFTYDQFPRIFEGASVFHFLPALDAYHPAVPRFLARLAQAPMPVGMLERFTRISGEPETEPDHMGPADEDIHNPLTHAVFSGNRLVAELLLKLGADPDCHHIDSSLRSKPFPSPSSWPLIHAATCQDTSMLRLLLEWGASVHVSRRPTCESRGWWGLGGPEVYWILPEAMTPLHLAAYRRRYDNVRVLVFHGADVRKECNLGDRHIRGHGKRLTDGGTARARWNWGSRSSTCGREVRTMSFCTRMLSRTQ
ncbi:hypothetical protein KFL_000350225 [Klebsormidium nitens]|uniref:Uncharacterized protein n=1 Tax=Klebsormidium nitens TaxID=105231 RepID=A0A1Y1HUZ0_KLENI|nr:hypothetical protein KFL_000350225 [Klebsormidium nitens]|eukprot:GAQ79668.1 hypothetical protein KFL_000350225 [Klebsormidium nitens]